MQASMTSDTAYRRIPVFGGFNASLEEKYDSPQTGRLLRVGLKMNTPPTCNWRCPYCYVGDPDAAKRPLQETVRDHDGIPLHRDPTWTARMKGWLLQAIDLGVQAVTLNGTFEPTAAKDWKDVILFLQDRGVAVSLVTNGGLLDEADLQWIAGSGINLLTKLNVPIVELDDPRLPELERIQGFMAGINRPAKEVYAGQVAFIERLAELGMADLRPDGTTRLGVESVIARINLPYLPELISQLRARNIYAHVELTKAQGYAQQNPELAIDREDVARLFEVVRQQDIAEGYQPYEAKPPYLAGACYENLFRVDIHADGTIKPCPGIETPIGDLNESSLAEIIRSPALEIIRNLPTTVQGDCKDCELLANRSCLAGCRGTAYQAMANAGRGEYERWTASDPSCWRVEKVLDDGTLAKDVFDVAMSRAEIADRRQPIALPFPAVR